MSFDSPFKPPLKTPVAFCIFNRPEPTRRVFEAIARRQPARLLLIADGARGDVDAEEERVQQTRDIVSQVDWRCDVEYNYSKTNLGCRERMATGLSWAFERCEELIVLEDDCLPDDSFFDFCQTLLEMYRNVPEVMMISGDNFQPESRTSDSYFFSQYTHIWGWASWRRAWEHYDIEMNDWPETRECGSLSRQFERPDEYTFWRDLFDQQHTGTIDTWDFAWEYACMKRGGLTILPDVNLISNIGFGIDATHTLDAGSRLSNLPLQQLSHLNHPTQIRRHLAADRWTFKNIFFSACPHPDQNPKKRWYKKMTDSLLRKPA